MITVPKFKLGTTIPVNKQRALDFFHSVIEKGLPNKKHESYNSIDGSLLLFYKSLKEDEVFVKFYCNLLSKESDSISYVGASLFLDFCMETGSSIQNLHTQIIFPASRGAFNSEIYSSQALRKAKHVVNHPKDKK